MYISDSDSDSDIEQYNYNASGNINMVDDLSLESCTDDDDDDVQSLLSTDSESTIIDDMSDYSSDSDSENEPEYISVIFQEDCSHLYMDKEDQQYYIGFCKQMHKPNLLLMANSVSSHTFFRHPYERIYQYLQNYSTLQLYSPKIEIMQLHITSDFVYSIVIKTFWLRIIQRHWKRTFRARQEMLQKRMTIQSLKIYELTSKFPQHLRNLPEINGMLHMYGEGR